jgi:hypothetical protein
LGKEVVHRCPITLLLVVKTEDARNRASPHPAKETEGSFDRMPIALFTFETAGPVDLKVYS